MIRFTEHAVMRYGRRIPGTTPIAQRAFLGKIQPKAPGSLTMSDPADAYLVHGEAVFPLRRVGDHYVAVTCLRHRRLPKAERRARRIAAHDDWMETA